MRYLFIIFVMGLVGLDHPMKEVRSEPLPLLYSGYYNKSEQMEIFKDIKGYEGHYQVSDIGRVKSLERYDQMNRFIKERILKSNLSSNGYFTVNLCKGKPQTYLIHQLVAMAFLGHSPNGYNGLIVDHIDFNRTNNHLSNLKLISMRKNTDQKHLKSSSKYIGVSWCNTYKKWYACIRINKKTKNLGYFTDELKASESYKSALNKIM